MTQIQRSDFAILSRFADRVRVIPQIDKLFAGLLWGDERFNTASQLVDEANATIRELKEAGRSHEEARDLCNKIVNMLREQPSDAQRRRWAREDRAERLREIRAEAYYNQ